MNKLISHRLLFLFLACFLTMQVKAPLVAWHTGLGDVVVLHDASAHHHSHVSEHHHDRADSSERHAGDLLDHHHHAPATETNTTASGSSWLQLFSDKAQLSIIFSPDPYRDPIPSRSIRPPII